MNQKEKFEYEAELKRVRNNATVEAYKIHHTKKEGREEGKAEGIKQEKYKMAKNPLSLGLDVLMIQKATGPSREEIEKIQQKNQ